MIIPSLTPLLNKRYGNDLKQDLQGGRTVSDALRDLQEDKRRTVNLNGRYGAGDPDAFR